MANLIPPQARDKVKREYWIRVVSLWMILAASALVMVALLAVPVYVLVKGQIGAFSDTYKSAAASDEQFKQSESLVLKANETAGLLAAHQEQSLMFSTVIAKLKTLADDGIDINNYQLSRSAGVVESVTVSGQADTRVQLADFKSRLEQDDMFDSAALPISNLAKDVNIPFSINITLNQP